MTIDKVQQTLKYLPEGVEIKGNAVVVQKFFEALATGADLLGELANYKELEEQGLLLRLPCKVGDTVYLIKSDGKIVPRTADMQFLGVLWEYYGKEWFLTQAEAEQKLKEMESDCNDKN